MSVVLISSFPEANQDGDFEIYSGSILEVGVSFLSNGMILDSAKFYLGKDGSPTGSCYAKLYSHTGKFNESGLPDGSALATSDAVDVSTLQAAGSFPYAHALATFDFTGTDRIKMVRNTPYIITINYEGGDSSNKIRTGIDVDNPNGSGNNCVYVSSWSADSDNSVCFYVYGDDTYVGPTVSNVYPIPPFKSSV